MRRDSKLYSLPPIREFAQVEKSCRRYAVDTTKKIAALLRSFGSVSVENSGSMLVGASGCPFSVQVSVSTALGWNSEVALTAYKSTLDRVCIEEKVPVSSCMRCIQRGGYEPMEKIEGLAFRVR
jgi:hypothetical protein